MTRTVADAAVLLAAMTGVDPRDAATKASAGKAADYVKGLNAGALKGARIGVARKRYFGYSPAADRLVDAAIAEMKADGVDVVGIGTGDDAFHSAARGLYESLGFTKIPIAGYLKRV